MRLESAQKLALFLPINAAGHIQGLLAIANRLREDHGKSIRCVFLMAGPPHSRTIEDHGHELIELDDAEPYYDFEIEPEDDLSKAMDEKTIEERLRQGRKRRAFRGAERWPQIAARKQYLFKVEPRTSIKQGMAEFVHEFSKYSLANSAQLDEVVDSLNPDVVICDTFLVQPTVLREEKTRPWIRVWSPNPMSLCRWRIPNKLAPPAFSGIRLQTKAKRELMRTTKPEAWQIMIDGWSRRAEEVRAYLHNSWVPLNEFYKKEGCSEQVKRLEDPFMARVESPHLNVYMYPEALDYDQDDDLFEYPKRWIRCDSLIRKEIGKNEAVENQHWIELIEKKKSEGDFKSVVYFSLGSIASGEPLLMQRYIDYLSADQSSRLYIVSKGVNGDQVKLSERNMIGANYLPQTFLLQQSDLAIIHGGNNSLTESFYYGKPVIVLPGFGDQFDNAQRVEDLGLGKRLDLYECTRDELMTAIETLTQDKELQTRACKIGSEMRARDDLGKVSELVWELIEKRHLSESTASRYGIKLG